MPSKSQVTTAAKQSIALASPEIKCVRKPANNMNLTGHLPETPQQGQPR